jgi:hypothetical protein
MILIDLNQVMISNIMVQIGNHHNAQIDENMLRHMILNTLRSLRNKFHSEYGELVICADDRNYWRKTLYPYYKASRKKDRQKSELDWNAIFTAINNVKAEIKEFFPYKVVQVEHAEADDAIGTIVHKYGNELNSGEPILILSGDKDYIQLHKYANVKQYDPVRKRWISHSDPVAYLMEHIIRGDSGDGVPNIMSSDSCLVKGERQKAITQKRLDNFLSTDPSTWNEEAKRNYHRNKALIDLSMIPDNIKEQVMEEFEKAPNDRSQLLNYFMKNKLRVLMEHITEF